MSRLLVCTLGIFAAVAVLSGQQVQTRLFGIGPAPATFFDDSTLQEVRLSISSRDWEALKEHFDENTYYPADFRWRNEVVRNVGIRSRGVKSRSSVKPGLRVDFDRYTSGQRFLGLKSVVLRNNTLDASNLNERLSMLMFRRVGLPASRESHATLYVNNEYAGLYTIVESVDKSFVQQAYRESEGYLYEYEWEGPYHFEYRGAAPSLYVPSPFQPHTHENDPRGEFIEQFVRAINETSDAEFRSVIAEYLDLPRFIRHVAVEQVVAESDGFLGDAGMANFYLYRFSNSHRFVVIPWDKSEAFKAGYTYHVFHNITDVVEADQNRLMRRLLSYADLLTLYLDTLQECARALGSPTADGPGWLEGEVEREYAQIHEAALDDPVKPYTNDEFEAAVEALREFARHRSEVIDDEVARTRDALAQSARYRQRAVPRSRKD